MSSMIFLLFGSWGKGAKKRSLRTWISAISKVILSTSADTKVKQKETLAYWQRIINSMKFIVQSKLVISEHIYLLIQNRIPPVPEYQASSPEVALLSLHQMQPSRE